MEKLDFLIQQRKTISRLKFNLKKKNRIVSTLQEDCQSFGLIVDKSLSFEEAFSFCIITVALSIAAPAEKLRQSGKVYF